MITLRYQTWAFLVSTLLIVLFVVSVVVLVDPLQAWYLRTAEGPALQKEFGFTAETIRPNTAHEARVFVISSVEPNGVFAKAGLKQGDRPWDYHGQVEARFYETLLYARDHDATMWVVRIEEDAHVRHLLQVPVRLERKAAGVLPEHLAAHPLDVGGEVQAPVAVEHVVPTMPEYLSVAGPLLMEAVIDKEGTVRSVRILRDGTKPSVGPAYVAALMKWRFRPGTVKGQPVDVKFRMSVNIDVR